MAKKTYLFLSILGFVIPNYYVYLILVEQNGFDLNRFISDISLNASSRFILIDLGIAATTFMVFLLYESRRLKIKLWWIPFVGTFLVGVSFGFPIFMYLRELALENSKAE
jgi:hypothetical protein